MMKRRKFLGALTAMVSWQPVDAYAQRAGKLPTIGLLVSGTQASHGQWVTVFVQRLHQLNWIEGRTVVIEYQWSGGHADHFGEALAEFVRRKVDIIVTNGNASVTAAKDATSVIPIVFAVAGDPVGTGLIESLRRPGGNVTGLSIQQTDTATKRLELLREIVTDLHRLAILANAGNPAEGKEVGDVDKAAKSLNIETSLFEIRRAEDFVTAFDAIKGRFEAVYFVGDPLLNSNRVRINTLASAARMPTIYSQRAFVDGGGLMSYGPSFGEFYRRAAEIVDKILRGTKPGDIPVEQPTKFELVINLTTAKALGLTISPTLLARADEVIE
jgi:putative ABC transport system substrate-binding protein